MADTNITDQLLDAIAEDYPAGGLTFALAEEVRRLRAEIERLRTAEQGRITNLRMLNEANAELSRLLAEIGRLRATGDHLAAAIETARGCGCDSCRSVAMWEKARRD